MSRTKVVKEYSFRSKDVQPPFSLNTTDVCFRGNKIGSVTGIEKLSNQKGSVYTATFSEPVVIKNNNIYYNNIKFAEIAGEIQSTNFGESVPDFFDPNKFENTKHRHSQSSPVIEKKEVQSATQLILDRINNKIKDWNHDELFDLYDTICKTK